MVYFSNILRIEEDVTEPVTLAEHKAWNQIDFTDRDPLLTTMGKSARLLAEAYTNLSLVEKTVSVDMELTKDEEARLPYCLVAEGLTITRLEANWAQGDELTEGADYNLRGNTIYGLSCGRYGLSYTAQATMDEALKEAIKMEVAARYNSRGEANATNKAEGLSEAARMKCEPYVQIWL